MKTTLHKTLWLVLLSLFLVTFSFDLVLSKPKLTVQEDGQISISSEKNTPPGLLKKTTDTEPTLTDETTTTTDTENTITDEASNTYYVSASTETTTTTDTENTITDEASNTYYVSASTGNDGNDGLSEANPIKSLSSVSKILLYPKDRVLLKRGDSWNEILQIKSSGSSADALISIGAYGEGGKPLIRNTIPISYKQWYAINSEVNAFTVIDGWCYGIFENGQKLKRASDSSLSDGNWFFSGREEPIMKIYYKPSSGALEENTLVEYAPTSYLVRIHGSFVSVNDLDLQYAGGGVVVTAGNKNVEINDCSISNVYFQAISFYNTAGNCAARRNVITQCGDGVYFIHDPGNPVGDNNIVSDNFFSDMNYEKLNKNDGHAVGLQNTSNNIIENNTMEYCVDAIAIWARSGEVANNNIVRRNYIQKCDNEKWENHNWGKGILIAPDDTTGTSGNKVYLNVIKSCKVGIKINKLSELPNKVYDNVIDNCDSGLKLSLGAEGIITKNNIFINSKKYHIHSEHSSNAENNVFNNNCYYPDMEFVHRSGVLKDFNAWKTRTGMDTRSILADPKFIDFDKYKIDTDSPVINIGENDLMLEEDFFGNKIVDIIDIGIFEVVANE